MIKWVVAGLGNPGKDYKGHRHSIGFETIERLQEAFGLPALQKKGDMIETRGNILGVPVLMGYPLKYMNLSGPAIVPWARFYQGARLVVIHDELDLPCGVVRYKKGGGTGGHRGLQSIHALMGPDYDRLRIGIDHPGHRDKVSAYVLSSFSPAQKPLIEKALQHLISTFDLMVAGKELSFIQNLHAPL